MKYWAINHKRGIINIRLIFRMLDVLWIVRYFATQNIVVNSDS